MSSQAAQSMRAETKIVGRDDARSDARADAGGQHGRAGAQGADGQSLKDRAESAARDAREKASALGENATEAAKAEAQRAADKARQLAEELNSQAAAIADQAVGRIKETADSTIAAQRDRAVGFVGSIEKAINAAAGSLEEDGYGTMANYVRYASDTLSSVNEEVGSIRPQRFTGQAERAVRRNPLLTYGALAVAGFAFVTLMSAQRDANRRGGGQGR